MKANVVELGTDFPVLERLVQMEQRMKNKGRLLTRMMKNNLDEKKYCY